MELIMNQLQLPPLCRKRWLFLPAIVLVICILLIGVIHAFGNPQWGRSIYLFQWRYFPKIRPIPPPGYSGTWTDWDKYGDMEKVRIFSQGQIIEKRLFAPFDQEPCNTLIEFADDTSSCKIYYHSNGRLAYIGIYSETPDSFNLFRNGNSSFWNEAGRLIASCDFVEDLPYNGIVPYNSKGYIEFYLKGQSPPSKYNLRYFIRGREVTEPEYRAAAKDNPMLPKPWAQQQQKTRICSIIIGGRAIF